MIPLGSDVQAVGVSGLVPGPHKVEQVPWVYFHVHEHPLVGTGSQAC
jgi:hypothetical protein